MLTKCVPWNQKLMFCATEHHYITSVIEQFIEEKKIGNFEIWTYIQFELDKNVFMEKLKTFPTTVPQGVEMRPLKPEDAYFIIEADDYKSSDLYSVAQIQFCIKKLCSVDRYTAGCSPVLDSTQIKQLDLTIQQNRSATAAELLSLTHSNTTERTIQRYRLFLGNCPRKSLVKVKSNNRNEQKRYQFAAAHYLVNIKKYIFEDECYVGLRNTQQILWCKRGESTPKREISSLRAHVNLIGFIWWNGYVFCRFDN
ncbi:unnamed protein product [Rotaria sordida]|uniref:Uncharacterized protein n=1 Tax=Rotaria sordida TaxID=392033 RepID=A0A814R1U5_9BILA|nr:unnamed protein product [Rotaria sordida]CAF1345860.1 unnamed protein product [Rotaria sordida]